MKMSCLDTNQSYYMDFTNGWYSVYFFVFQNVKLLRHTKFVGYVERTQSLYSVSRPHHLEPIIFLALPRS